MSGEQSFTHTTRSGIDGLDSTDDSWLPEYFSTLVESAHRDWVPLSEAASFLKSGALKAFEIIYRAVGPVGPPSRPEPGSLFIVDERRLPNWRDDGYIHEPVSRDTWLRPKCGIQYNNGEVVGSRVPFSGLQAQDGKKWEQSVDTLSLTFSSMPVFHNNALRAHRPSDCTLILEWSRIDPVQDPKAKKGLQRRALRLPRPDHALSRSSENVNGEGFVWLVQYLTDSYPPLYTNSGDPYNFTNSNTSSDLGISDVASVDQSLQTPSMSNLSMLSPNATSSQITLSNHSKPAPLDLRSSVSKAVGNVDDPSIQNASTLSSYVDLSSSAHSDDEILAALVAAGVTLESSRKLLRGSDDSVSFTDNTPPHIRMQIQALHLARMATKESKVENKNVSVPSTGLVEGFKEPTDNSSNLSTAVDHQETESSSALVPKNIDNEGTSPTLISKHNLDTPSHPQGNNELPTFSTVSDTLHLSHTPRRLPPASARKEDACVTPSSPVPWSLLHQDSLLSHTFVEGIDSPLRRVTQEGSPTVTSTPPTSRSRSTLLLSKNVVKSLDVSDKSNELSSILQTSDGTNHHFDFPSDTTLNTTVPSSKLEPPRTPDISHSNQKLSSPFPLLSEDIANSPVPSTDDSTDLIARINNSIAKSTRMLQQHTPKSASDSSSPNQGIVTRVPVHDSPASGTRKPSVASPAANRKTSSPPMSEGSAMLITQSVSTEGSFSSDANGFQRFLEKLMHEKGSPLAEQRSSNRVEVDGYDFTQAISKAQDVLKRFDVQRRDTLSPQKASLPTSTPPKAMEEGGRMAPTTVVHAFHHEYEQDSVLNSTIESNLNSTVDVSLVEEDTVEIHREGDVTTLRKQIEDTTFATAISRIAEAISSPSVPQVATPNASHFESLLDVSLHNSTVLSSGKSSNASFAIPAFSPPMASTYRTANITANEIEEALRLSGRLVEQLSKLHLPSNEPHQKIPVKTDQSATHDDVSSARSFVPPESPFVSNSPSRPNSISDAEKKAESQRTLSNPEETLPPRPYRAPPVPPSRIATDAITIERAGSISRGKAISASQVRIEHSSLDETFQTAASSLSIDVSIDSDDETHVSKSETSSDNTQLTSSPQSNATAHKAPSTSLPLSPPSLTSPWDFNRHQKQIDTEYKEQEALIAAAMQRVEALVMQSSRLQTSPVLLEMHSRFKSAEAAAQGNSGQVPKQEIGLQDVLESPAPKESTQDSKSILESTANTMNASPSAEKDSTVFTEKVSPLPINPSSGHLEPATQDHSEGNSVARNRPRRPAPSHVLGPAVITSNPMILENDDSELFFTPEHSFHATDKNRVGSFDHEGNTAKEPSPLKSPLRISPAKMNTVDQASDVEDLSGKSHVLAHTFAFVQNKNPAQRSPTKHTLAQTHASPLGDSNNKTMAAVTPEQAVAISALHNGPQVQSTSISRNNVEFVGDEGFLAQEMTSVTTEKNPRLFPTSRALSSPPTTRTLQRLGSISQGKDVQQSSVSSDASPVSFPAVDGREDASESNAVSADRRFSRGLKRSKSVTQVPESPIRTSETHTKGRLKQKRDLTESFESIVSYESPLVSRTRKDFGDLIETYGSNFADNKSALQKPEHRQKEKPKARESSRVRGKSIIKVLDSGGEPIQDRGEKKEKERNRRKDKEKYLSANHRSRSYASEAHPSRERSRRKRDSKGDNKVQPQLPPMGYPYPPNPYAPLPMAYPPPPTGYPMLPYYPPIGYPPYPFPPMNPYSGMPYPLSAAMLPQQVPAVSSVHTAVQPPSISGQSAVFGHANMRTQAQLEAESLLQDFLMPSEASVSNGDALRDSSRNQIPEDTQQKRLSTTEQAALDARRERVAATIEKYSPLRRHTLSPGQTSALPSAQSTTQSPHQVVAITPRSSAYPSSPLPLSPPYSSSSHHSSPTNRSPYHIASLSLNNAQSIPLPRSATPPYQMQQQQPPSPPIRSSYTTSKQFPALSSATSSPDTVILPNSAAASASLPRATPPSKASARFLQNLPRTARQVLCSSIRGWRVRSVWKLSRLRALRSRILDTRDLISDLKSELGRYRNTSGENGTTYSEEATSTLKLLQSSETQLQNAKYELVQVFSPSASSELYQQFHSQPYIPHELLPEWELETHDALSQLLSRNLQLLFKAEIRRREVNGTSTTTSDASRILLRAPLLPRHGKTVFDTVSEQGEKTRRNVTQRAETKKPTTTSKRVLPKFKKKSQKSGEDNEVGAVAISEQSADAGKQSKVQDEGNDATIENGVRDGSAPIKPWLRARQMSARKDGAEGDAVEVVATAPRSRGATVSKPQNDFDANQSIQLSKNSSSQAALVPQASDSTLSTIGQMSTGTNMENSVCTFGSELGVSDRWRVFLEVLGTRNLIPATYAPGVLRRPPPKIGAAGTNTIGNAAEVENADAITRETLVQVSLQRKSRMETGKSGRKGSTVSDKGAKAGAGKHKRVGEVDGDSDEAVKYVPIGKKIGSPPVESVGEPVYNRKFAFKLPPLGGISDQLLAQVVNSTHHYLQEEGQSASDDSLRLIVANTLANIPLDLAGFSVCVEVLDGDRFARQTHLGAARIDLSQVPIAKSASLWLPLEPEKPEDNVRGEIQIRIKLLSPDPEGYADVLNEDLKSKHHKLLELAESLNESGQEGDPSNTSDILRTAKESSSRDSQTPMKTDVRSQIEVQRDQSPRDSQSIQRSPRGVGASTHSRANSPSKNIFLRRKSAVSVVSRKLDWSHVQAKTSSRMKGYMPPQEIAQQRYLRTVGSASFEQAPPASRNPGSRDHVYEFDEERISYDHAEHRGDVESHAHPIRGKAIRGGTSYSSERFLEQYATQVDAADDIAEPPIYGAKRPGLSNPIPVSGASASRNVPSVPKQDIRHLLEEGVKYAKPPKSIREKKFYSDKPPEIDERGAIEYRPDIPMKEMDWLWLQGANMDGNTSFGLPSYKDIDDAFETTSRYSDLHGKQSKLKPLRHELYPSEVHLSTASKSSGYSGRFLLPTTNDGVLPNNRSRSGSLQEAQRNIDALLRLDQEASEKLEEELKHRFQRQLGDDSPQLDGYSHAAMVGSAGMMKSSHANRYGGGRATAYFDEGLADLPPDVAEEVRARAHAFTQAIRASLGTAAFSEK